MCFGLAKTFTPTDSTFENGSTELVTKANDKTDDCGLDHCDLLPKGMSENNVFNNLKTCQCECSGDFCKQLGLDKRGKDPCADDIKDDICPTLAYDPETSKRKFDITCPDGVDCLHVYGKFSTECDADTNTCTIDVVKVAKKFFDKKYPNRKEGQKVFTREDRKKNFDKVRHTFANYKKEEDPYRPDDEDPVGQFFYDSGMGVGLVFTSGWDALFPQEVPDDYVEPNDYYAAPDE